MAASGAAGGTSSQRGNRTQRTFDGNFSLGRIGGIEVRLNWSLIAVVVLIAWSLEAGVFPSTNPGLSHGTYIAMGIVAAVLFLASILLHELGHSLVARREGIEVDSITLWLFGGVSQFKGRYKSPGDEFRVAFAGPLVSILLGVVFVLIALAHLRSSVDGVAAWLGYINLILAAFNLLPAAPLDGGRVLHSILWRAKGDYNWATRIASEVGQGFAYLFIALGLVMFVFQGSFSGAWLAFIGWFLLQGAKAEARYAATEQALGDARVRDLMARHPETVDADSTLGQFMDEVARTHHRFTTYPVLDGGAPVGLLAFASVAAVPRSEWDTRLVRDTMIPLDQVPQLREDERAVDALAELSEGSSRGLVVDNGHLAGLLSITDLARTLEVGRRPAQPHSEQSRRGSMQAAAEPPDQRRSS